MTDERFQQLFESYVDQTLDEEASRELLDAFAADAALKARFLDELRTANALHCFAQLDEDRLASEVLESIRLGKNSPDVSDAVLAELKDSGTKVIKFPWPQIAGIGIAAAIAIAMVILLGGRTGEPLATVAQTVGVEWAADSRLHEGESIGAGRVRLLAGVVRLDFADGVRVTLEGPAELELIRPGETRLHAGALTAHVPPEGIGFQVHTEKAAITDLGTTFGVSVGDDGSTDVLVFEGEVEVASPAEKRKGKIIREGNAVSVGNGSVQPRAVPFEPRSFRRGWNVLFGVLNTNGRIRFVNAQPVSNPAQVEDRENIIVFPERFNITTEDDLAVTITDPGDYPSAELRQREEVLTLGGRRVNTYLLQYNPPAVDGAREQNVPFVGEVTFDRPILAVIANPDQLKASDGRLGKKRFDYDTGLIRSLEHGDNLHLSEDRRTLGIDWLVMPSLEKGIDQIRVIVDAEGRDARP